MNEIVMPKLSDTMTEGRVVSWKKRVGEAINRGDVLAEVETDKANMELEAFSSGVLLEIKVQAGEMAQVGTVIALIGSPEEKGAAGPEGAAGKVEPPARPAGEAEPQAEPAAEVEPPAQPAGEAEPQPQPSQPAPAEQEPAASGQVPEQHAPPATPSEGGGTVAPSAEAGQPAAGAPGGETSAAALANATTGAEGEKQAPSAPLAAAGEEQAPSQPEGEGEQIPVPPPARQGGPGEPPPQGREKAAPVVRRRARELGIDLAQVEGSGPDGRILMKDLEGREGKAPRAETVAAPAAAAQPTAPAGAAQPASPAEAMRPAAPAPRPTLEEGVKAMPRLRAAVAKTVTQSWNTVPHFTVTMDISMDDAMSLRRQLKESGVAITVNDMVVKAVSLALQQFPQYNASLTAEGIRFHSEVNIGVAVGVKDGVLIPVIAGCQRLSLQEISRQGHQLAERARIGALTEQEMGGGSFAISNLGMYGISHFTAIIYPAHSAVLAVGAVTDTVLVRDGVPAVGKVMKVTLCSDHRLVDGVYAAEFLVELKHILENPVRLLL